MTNSKQETITEVLVFLLMSAAFGVWQENIAAGVFLFFLFWLIRICGGR